MSDVFTIAFGEALNTYLASGWVRAFPIGNKPRQKAHPPTGITGEHGRRPTREEFTAWRRLRHDTNLGIAMPMDLVGIDVDHYDDKRGAGNLANVERELGVTLPPTVRSTSRPDTPSGIYIYRVPPGLHWRGELCPDVEIIAWHYRYAVVWPSIHPEGRPYQWFDDAGEVLTRVPQPNDDWPDLPWQFIAHATRDPDEPADYAPAKPQRAERSAWHPKVAAKLAEFDQRTGSRHEAAKDISIALARQEQLGLSGATSAIDELRDRFITAVTQPGTGQRSHPQAAAEWGRMISGARFKVETTKSTVLEDRERDRAFTENIRVISNGSEPDSDQSPDLPGNEFWDTRSELQRIRDFARARRCSPWAVLGVVLVRVAAGTPPFVVLPPQVGSHLSLNTYVGLVGPSGAGKDAAIAAGIDAIAMDTIKVVGLGSGEGLLDQYVSYRQPDKKSGDPGGVEQHTTSVIFTAPEVETLAALKGRSSATLMPELRNAWTGGRLGFAYANRERRLYIDAHHYRLGLIVGIQPERASVLLDDTSAGTPQRFLWLPATDPDAPETAPEEPHMLSWECPKALWRHGAGDRFELEVCSTAKTAIDQARLDRLRGEGDALDGHALACRLKIAALLAILGGRVAVSDDDWKLAGHLQAVSDRTRDSAAWAVEFAQRQANQARGKAEGEREIVKTETVEAAATARVAALVRRKLTHAWVTHSDLRGRLPGRDRRYFDNAIERLRDAGQIQVDEAEYRGQKGARYRSAEGVDK